MSAAFLRIPPFPGHRASPLTVASQQGDGTSPAALAAMLRERRVGGCFWGRAPALPGHVNIVLAPNDAGQFAEMLANHDPASVAVFDPDGMGLPSGVTRLPSDCDLWALAECGRPLRVGAGQELALVASLAGADVSVEGSGPFAGCDADDDALHAVLAEQALDGIAYRCPFTGKASDALSAAAQLGEWRALMTANRDIAAIHGIAGWKRQTLDALLWDGTGPVRYARELPSGASPPAQVLAWKSRSPPALLARLQAEGFKIGEIEDGMIRSSGLGANCVPPLSAIVDLSGVYFDPSGPSDLEHLLENARIDDHLKARAASLRETLVAQTIGKYGRDAASRFARRDARRLVLVAGQVADDRSVQSGGGECSNFDLVCRAREVEGDAYIVYKPHPDVEAGHRKGRIPDAQVLRHADEVVRDAPITALLDAADSVHVITSLAGFEALLRGKSVTTHGVPFYAGWGLTHDMAPIPQRRTRTRSLDELVAATLLLYPRYVDPVTRLPCPAEVLVQRIAADEAHVASALVSLRTLQGRANRALARLTGAGR